MWAQVLVSPSAMELREVEVPKVSQGSEQVLLKLLAGAICGSDLPLFRGDHGPNVPSYGVPGRPLHEFVGEVVDPGTSQFDKGQRVVGWAHDKSGLAEYLLAEASSLILVDDRLDAVEATTIQPLACAIYAVDRLHTDVAGSRAAVIGQGPLGLLFSHVLKDRGAAVVTGVDLVDRSDVRGSFGVDDIVWDSCYNWARSLDDATRPQIIIEAVGHQVETVNEAIEAIAPFGEIYAFGVPACSHYPIEFAKLFRKDATLQAGVTHERQRYLNLAQDYILRYQSLSKDYISHTFSLKDAEAAYRLASLPQKGRLKVAIVPE